MIFIKIPTTIFGFHSIACFNSSDCVLSRNPERFQRQLDVNCILRITLYSEQVGDFKQQIVAKDTMTALESVKISQCLQDESRLQFQQNELRIEVVELVRLAAIKVSVFTSATLSILNH